jgi:hypothetical protein
VAVLGGAMNGRIVEEMHKDWTEASKASSNQDINELLSKTDRRCTIRGNIMVSFVYTKESVSVKTVSCLQNLSYAK